MAMTIETREERAKMIVAEKDGVKMVRAGVFSVRSQSGNGAYRVEENGGWRCNCPDYLNRGGECKHILATRFYLEIQRDTPEGTVTDKVRISYPQAWAAYNAAQMDEVRAFDALLRDLVEAIPEPEQAMGRPRIPIQEQLFCAIQKVYSQLSSRRAYSLFQNAKERGQIDHAPHFNTPSKLLNRADITPILHQLIQLSALPVAGIETDFSIDSTGFRTTSYSAYYGEKHGQKRINNWLKAHICAGVKTNIVASIVITDNHTADTTEFIPLLNKTAEAFKIGEISADMAYISRANIDAVVEAGGQPYIPFRNNCHARARGAAMWNKMYHYFQMNREEFMAHYHKRSNIEATNAAIKRKFGETIKSKTFTAQVNELLCKIIAYNLTVVIHEIHEHGVRPDFLNLKSPVCTQSQEAMGV
jgi:transposase